MAFLESLNSSSKVLIIDIGSGSTSSAVVQISNSHIPSILRTSRESFIFPERPSSEILELAVLKSLSESVKCAVGISLDRVIISFSSPWIITKLKTINLRKEENQPLNQKRVMEILEKEDQGFKNEIESKYDGKAIVFESKITKISINGYELIRPVNNISGDASISVSLSATKADLIEKVENLLRKTIGVRDNINFESFMYAFLKTMCHSFQSTQSFALISMEDEVSDFMLVNNSTPTVVTSLSFGQGFIRRNLEKELGVPPEIADSYLTLMNDGVLQEELAEKIQNIIVSSVNTWKEVWLKERGDKAIELSGSAKVFLLSKRNSRKIMKEMLQEVFIDHEVVALGVDNLFTKELITYAPETKTDEKINILAAYSSL